MSNDDVESNSAGLIGRWGRSLMPSRILLRHGRRDETSHDYTSFSDGLRHSCPPGGTSPSQIRRFGDFSGYTAIRGGLTELPSRLTPDALKQARANLVI